MDIEKYERLLGLKYELMITMGNKFDQYKSRAKGKGLLFKLTFQIFDTLIKMPCHYCGLKKDLDVVGIDRFDNNLGYVSGNCVPCCWDCNRSKSNLKPEEYVNYIKRFNPNLDMKKFNKIPRW